MLVWFWVLVAKRTATSLGHRWVKWERWAVACRPLGSGGGCRQVAASQSVRLVQCSDVNFPGEGGGHGWPGWLGWFPLVPSLNAAAPGSGFEVIAVVMLNKNFEIRKFIKNSQVLKMVSLLKSFKILEKSREVSENTRGFPKTCEVSRKHARFPENLRGFPKTCEVSRKLARFPENSRGFPKTREVSRKLARFPENSRGFPKTCEVSRKLARFHENSRGLEKTREVSRKLARFPENSRGFPKTREVSRKLARFPEKSRGFPKTREVSETFFFFSKRPFSNKCFSPSFFNKISAFRFFFL